MALSITGIDPATGRVIPKGTNVLIPKENAGIGDLVYKNGANIRIIGRGTANAASIAIGGVTYSLYGVIYGFVAGMAMVAAPGETSAYWAASGVSCSVGPEYGAGTVLMRNGRKTNYYAQMNTAQNANYIKGGSSAPVTLGAAYQATSLTGDSDFNALPAASEIKNKFGSWTEYIRQTLRVNGAPGTPFGASYTDGEGNVVKVHEFGRWMTRKVYTTLTPANFPAIKYCYEYGEGGGVWWLPSMFELAELMIDEHLTLVRQNAGIITDVSPGSGRWSCVRYSSGYAWLYNNLGMSNNRGMSAYSFSVRPVTLLKLV